MKYTCLGYIEDKYFTGLSPNEQQTFMDTGWIVVLKNCPVPNSPSVLTQEEREWRAS
jgi:hypothetical protein